MARRAFRPRISESQRRKKAWIAVKSPTNAGDSAALALFTTSINISTASTSASIGSFTSNLLGAVDAGGTSQGDERSTLPEESTILRARGSLLFPKNLAQSGNDGAVQDNYAFGFGVTDIRSIVNGVAPLPITDVDWDGWMFLRQSAVTPVDSEGTVVDVKAMRKIKTGDAFFVSVQSLNGLTVVTTGQDWTFDLRLLMLLP